MTYRDALLQLQSDLQEDLDSLTRGLYEKFGEEVRHAPNQLICEQMGRAVAQGVTLNDVLEQIDSLIGQIREQNLE